MRHRDSAWINRREALRRGLLGGGWLLSSGGGLRTEAAAQPARAKAVIQIWMWGGPSHLDTFDPKPAAGFGSNVSRCGGPPHIQI